MQSLDYDKAISNYAKSTDWPLALHLFAELHLKALRASDVTYNSAINACARAGKWRSAMVLLHDLEIVGLANVISYSTAISSCEKAGEWQVALLLLESLKHKKLQLNVIPFNAVITACAKGCLIDADFDIGWLWFLMVLKCFEDWDNYDY